MAARPLPSGGVARDTCYFDGRCGLCRRTARILGALDWLGTLEFVDQSALSDAELPVSRDLALSGMPMRTAAGRVLVGFPAVRRALARTPLGLAPAALLYVPGLNRVGARAYAWIAQNRGRDAVCDAGMESRDSRARRGPVGGAGRTA